MSSVSTENTPLIEPVNVSVKKFNQYLTAIIANIIGISWGTTIGWSSPAIAKMANGAADSPLAFVPTANQLSWIGSIHPLGGFVGPIFFASLPGLIGRKCALMVNALFLAVSFLLLILTNDIMSIYVARFFQGWGSGVVMLILPMYIGEIASPDCRGILSSFIMLGFVIGILYSFCIGPFVDYVTFQYFCMAIPVIFTVLFGFFPDSPHYYVSKGNHCKAVQSLEFFRGRKGQKIIQELEEIELSVCTFGPRRSLSSFLVDKANVTAVTIVFGLVCLQCLTGIDAVLFYSETIFEKAGSSLDSAIATIIIGVVMLVSSLISPFFVDSSGRKILLLVSAAGMAVSLTTMGVYFFLDARDLMSGFGWLPVTTLVTFILFYCVGFGPLPFTILGEMFAPEIKLAASSFAVSASWIIDFGVTKAFLPLEGVVGSYGNFWIFGGFCVAAFIFTAFVVVETRGLTLDEIQNKLNTQRSNSRLRAEV